MPLFAIACGVLVIFGMSYAIYGRILTQLFRLNPDTVTPASQVNDGVDFVPTKTFLLLGQHFSAIAAAGPIVGPILACLWFGWLPALLWIVIGSVCIGALHDFASMVASVRNEGKSVAEIMKVYMGREAYIGFLIFIWISLIYVITAFADLTSSAFVDAELGGAVASASTMYLGLGIIMGLTLRFIRAPLWLVTTVFVAAVGASIWYSQYIPLILPSIGGLSPKMVWNVMLMVYCFIASVIPVWLLLQPRGYLGGWFLYCVLGAGTFGLLLGGETVQYPAFLGMTSPDGMHIVPFLFVTIACGACSGFHGIVSSGTTSKQVDREPDCCPVGYGAMLLEGFVAVIALATVMVLAHGSEATGYTPGRIYADGIARFVGQLGIPLHLASTFALLAFTTFIYDTLDVATRLGRHILQELTGWSGLLGRYGATALTVALPCLFVGITITNTGGQAVPAWKAYWILFGSSNQLLAALTLTALAVWMYRTGRPWIFLSIPALFMLLMTLWALWATVWPWVQQILIGEPTFDMKHFVGVILIGLALFIVARALRVTQPSQQGRSA
jgi:carbon starvation protein